MGIKFIIFAVLASLAQCSLTLRSTVTDEQSDGDSGEPDQITIYQEKAVQYALGAADLIFDVHQNYVSILIASFDAVTTDDASKIAEATSNAKATVDATLDAIKVVFRGSCSDIIEQSRAAAHISVDDMYASATTGWYLGVARDFPANREQIEAYELKAQGSFVDLVENVFNSIRLCVNSEDPAVVALFQYLQDTAGSYLSHVVSTFFLATKVYATADPENRSLLLVSQALRNEATTGYVSAVENTFAGIWTLDAFYSLGMDNTGRLPVVLGNEYFQIATKSKFKEAVDVVVGLITAALRIISLGSSGNSIADFSAIDAAKAKAISKINAGNTVFFKSALAGNPNATEEVAATEALFLTVVPQMIANFVEATIVAQDSDINYAESMEKIQTIRETQLSYGTAYAENFIGLIGIDEPSDTDIGVQLPILVDKAEVAAHAFVDSMIDSIEIVAKCADRGEAGEEDFAAIRANADSTKSALDDFIRLVSTAAKLFY